MSNMAINATTSSIFHRLLLSTNFFFSLLLVCNFVNKGCALDGNDAADTRDRYRPHVVKISSLLPSNACNPVSTQAPLHKKAASLRVVHKNGPCSHLNKHGENYTPIDHAKILEQDQLRVNSIQSQLSNYKSGGPGVGASKSTDSAVPVRSGETIGSANYIVTLGLGTPKKELSLVFDTGSALTWTQCEPCLRYCYKQKEPIFKPLESTSYANVSCDAEVCRALEETTGISPGCVTKTCSYGIQYGDRSYSVGYLVKERLALTPYDVLENFYFGCGQNNRGLFQGSAGILGLSRDKSLSLIRQLPAKKYGQYFSYCLPSSRSSTGFLSFGHRKTRKAIKFTPMSTLTEGTQFYGLDMTGISVGGKRLPIPTSVFSTPGTIIDSGTVVTRLPPKAYNAMRKAFRGLMSDYPPANEYSILDTCYDFSGLESVLIPKISFFFGGGVEVEVYVSGIFIVVSESQVCLAFAGNSDDSDVGIFGNLPQLTWEVAYDVGGGRVGFSPSAC